MDLFRVLCGRRPRFGRRTVDEDQKGFIDQLKYGQSFMLDGKRIDPKDIYMDKPQVIYAYRRKGLDYFCTCDKEQYTELADKPHLFEVTVFYTATPSKPWVSLTDDEAYQLLVDYCDDDLGLLNAIEAALRKLNHG